MEKSLDLKKESIAKKDSKKPENTRKRRFKFRPKRIINKIKTMNNKKRTIIILISVITLFLLLLTTFGRLYLSLNVILGHDILIDLRVNHDYLSVLNNEQASLEFKTSVTSNPFCSAQCNYRFVDISNNEIIDEDSFMITTLIPIEKKYDVMTEKGSGSKIYRFEISCSSERTFLCRTTEEERLRHLSVVVEHNLDEEQLDSKIKSLSLYEELANSHNKSVMDYFLIEKNLPKIMEYYVISNRSLLIRGLIEENNNSLNRFKQVWQDQEYEELFLLINKHKLDFTSNVKTIYNDYLSLNEKFDLHNELLYNLSKSKNLVENITTSIIFTQENISIINQTLKILNETIQDFHEREDIKSTMKRVSTITNDIEILYFRLYSEHISLKNNITESLYIFRERLCEEVTCSEDYENYTHIFNASKETICNEIEMSLNNASEHNITDIYLPNECLGLKTIIPEIRPSKLIFEDYENYEIDTSEFDVAKTLSKNPDICCLFNECQPCCYSKECTKSPIIFVHGHAIDHRTPPDYSMDGFNKLQLKLEEEGVLSMGRISLYNYFDLPKNIWGRFGVPISLKVSYYYDIFTEDESSIIVPTKNENLETYAIRLREIIDSVLYKTNNSKTIIFAHSMGGLVTRRYMQIFGTENVDRVMLLGVPNHGVTGIIADLCPVFGENLECRDLRKESLFLNKLNAGIIPTIPVYNIVAIGCEMREGDGDGVVLRESAWLDFAENFIIEGDCNSGKILHSEFIRDIDDSEFIGIVRDFLNE